MPCHESYQKCWFSARHRAGVTRFITICTHLPCEHLLPFVVHYYNKKCKYYGKFQSHSESSGIYPLTLVHKLKTSWKPVSWFIASLSWKSLVAFLSATNMWLRWSSSSSVESSIFLPTLSHHAFVFTLSCFPGLLMLLAVSKPHTDGLYTIQVIQSVFQGTVLQHSKRCTIHTKPLIATLIPVNLPTDYNEQTHQVFRNDLDDGTEHTLCKFAGSTKSGEVADTSDHCAAMQRDLDRPEKWAGRNLMKFRKGKCRVLCLGNNLRHQKAGKQFCRDSLDDPDGHQVEHELGMCPCTQEVRQPPGLHFSRLKRGSFPFTHSLVKEIWNARSNSGLPSRRRTSTYWNESGKGPWRWLRNWRISHEEKLRQKRIFIHSGEEKAQGDHSYVYISLKVRTKGERDSQIFLSGAQW